MLYLICAIPNTMLIPCSQERWSLTYVAGSRTPELLLHAQDPPLKLSKLDLADAVILISCLHVLA